MKMTRTTTVGLFAAALLVGTAAVGCGSDDKGSDSSSSATSSSAAASTSAAASETTSASATAAPAGDYSKLLLKASDIDPSFTASPPETPPAGITGIGQTMANTAQNQTITFQIAIEADPPAAAAKRLDESKATVSKDVDGAPQPADVGDGGFIATGKSPDARKPSPRCTSPRAGQSRASSSPARRTIRCSRIPRWPSPRCRTLRSRTTCPKPRT